MINNRWEKRTYVTAVDDDLDPDPGGGGSQEVEMDRQRGDGRADQARLQGRDLQKEAARKKYYFQQKMNLEGNRKSLGAGNIITFLVNNVSRQAIEMNDCNKILRIGGFLPEQVITIKKMIFDLIKLKFYSRVMLRLMN